MGADAVFGWAGAGAQTRLRWVGVRGRETPPRGASTLRVPGLPTQSHSNRGRWGGFLRFLRERRGGPGKGVGGWGASAEQPDAEPETGDTRQVKAPFPRGSQTGWEKKKKKREAGRTRELLPLAARLKTTARHSRVARTWKSPRELRVPAADATDPAHRPLGPRWWPRLSRRPRKRLLPRHWEPISLRILTQALPFAKHQHT